MSNAFDKLNKAQSTRQNKVKSSFEAGNASKGGRPAKSASEKRDNRLTVYLSTSELKQLTDYCDELGVQPAVFLRTQAMNKISK
ncbi:hypothetical protein GTH32_18150 [Alteromonas sp. 345S023]|uniref:Uncharacterized protein n=1 Tax=Alteromonas profundi TaxID=2696062 RepID=A0A7X5LQD4_9ALTE|nr:hypothetical protein [Alteromonas profundi]NDV93094.1 hypothetical protein [Alteromonas profundi]